MNSYMIQIKTLPPPKQIKSLLDDNIVQGQDKKWKWKGESRVVWNWNQTIVKGDLLDHKNML